MLFVPGKMVIETCVVWTGLGMGFELEHDALRMLRDVHASGRGEGQE